MGELELEIERDLLQQLQVVAMRDGCSVDEKIKQLVSQCIERFESENGEIQLAFRKIE